MTTHMKYFLILALLLLLPAALANAQTQNADSQILESDAITPGFAKTFQSDYITFKPDNIMKWISPRRGLVQDGVLMSRDYTNTKMSEFQKEMKEIKNPEMLFVRGYYNRTSLSNARSSKSIVEGKTPTTQPTFGFYKAFYQLSFDLEKIRQKINIIAVFEKLDGKWYLVQTQNLRMSRGGINSPTTESFALQTDQLTIGDMPLDFEGVTFSTTKKSRRFASKMARNRQRPTLLYFFTLISVDSGAQMDWAETLYPKYKDKNVYIFCVTDDEPEYIKWYIEQGKWNVGVLRDVNSLMHHDLEVDIHPYIILLDHWGVVRTISRGYNEESLELVESVMDEIIDEANRAIALEKKGGPPIHK